jgi:hypothetical protein
MCNLYFITDEKVFVGILWGDTHHLNPQDLILAQINGPIKSWLLRLPYLRHLKVQYRSEILCTCKYNKGQELVAQKIKKYIERGKSFNSCTFYFQNYYIILEGHTR